MRDRFHIARFAAAVRHAALAGAVALGMTAPTAAHAAAGTSVQRLAVGQPSPLLDGEQYNRRLQSPIFADDLRRFVEAGGRRLVPEAFDGGEVDAWLPPDEPPDGYGLLLFVLPDDSVALPADYVLLSVGNVALPADNVLLFMGNVALPADNALLS